MEPLRLALSTSPAHLEEYQRALRPRDRGPAAAPPAAAGARPGLPSQKPSRAALPLAGRLRAAGAALDSQKHDPGTPLGGIIRLLRAAPPRHRGKQKHLRRIAL